MANSHKKIRGQPSCKSKDVQQQRELDHQDTQGGTWQAENGETLCKKKYKAAMERSEGSSGRKYKLGGETERTSLSNAGCWM